MFRPVAVLREASMRGKKLWNQGSSMRRSPSRGDRGTPDARRETMRAALRVAPDAGTAVELSDQRGRVRDRLAGAPFVGRESELGSLLAAFQESTAGRGQLCLVVGEPGIGKTRLAEEVADRAMHGGALVLWGRCWEEGGSPSYWPWIQIVRACVRRLDAAALAAKLGPAPAYIAQIVPEVREKLSPVPAPPPLDVEQARFRLFAALASFLGRVADAQPLLLVLDALHSADHTSFLLLRFIARKLHALPILCWRPTETPKPAQPLRRSTSS